MDEEEFRKVATAIERTSSELTEARGKLRNLRKTGDENLSPLQRKFDGLNGVVGNLSARFLSLTAILGGVALGIRGAFNAALSFESAFTGVRKTLDLTTSDFEILEEQLIGITKRLPIAFEEVAKIAEIAGQLGVQGSDIEQFTETIAQLGETTNLSTEEAAFALSRFQALLGVT